mgnify:CR=1 FL=1
MKTTKPDLSTSLSIAYGHAYLASVDKDCGDFEGMVSNLKAAKASIDGILKSIEEPKCVVLLHPSVTRVADIPTPVKAVFTRQQSPDMEICVINSRKEFDRIYNVESVPQ